MRSIEEIAAELEEMAYRVSPVSSIPRPCADDPRDREDSATRQAYGTGGKRPWGRGLRAAFYAELPPTPLGRVSRDQARLYLSAVVDVIERRCWSQRETEKLRVIRRRWEARVDGRDERFKALGGVYPGGVRVPADARRDRVNMLRREAGI